MVLRRVRNAKSLLSGVDGVLSTSLDVIAQADGEPIASTPSTSQPTSPSVPDENPSTSQPDLTPTKRDVAG